MAIPFPQSVVDEAWKRSGGQCECRRDHFEHAGFRCPERLSYWDRGSEGPGGWEAHHKNSNGPAIASNCEILCQECHKRTRSFGR